MNFLKPESAMNSAKNLTPNSVTPLLGSAVAANRLLLLFFKASIGALFSSVDMKKKSLQIFGPSCVCSAKVFLDLRCWVPRPRD